MLLAKLKIRSAALFPPFLRILHQVVLLLREAMVDSPKAVIKPLRELNPIELVSAVVAPDSLTSEDRPTDMKAVFRILSMIRPSLSQATLTSFLALASVLRLDHDIIRFSLFLQVAQSIADAVVQTSNTSNVLSSCVIPWQTDIKSSSKCRLSTSNFIFLMAFTSSSDSFSTSMRVSWFRCHILGAIRQRRSIAGRCSSTAFECFSVASVCPSRCNCVG